MMLYILERGTYMLRKYVTDIAYFIGLFKYVTDFEKITLDQIVKNIKYVTKLLNLNVGQECLKF